MNSKEKILFLDANVLFSAAYREDSKLSIFWKLKKTNLITSSYALEEARRNLKTQEQRIRLEVLASKLKITSHEHMAPLPPEVILKDKDRPILAAAIHAKADFLITGDFQDFGKYFGTAVIGVMILPPAGYLAQHHKEQ